MIVVFGSLNIDLVLPVRDFPRPGETTFCDDYVWLAGGKGMNQAVAAVRSGSRVAMVGCVGADAFGQTLVDALEREGIETAHVMRTKKASGCATVMVNEKGENEILVARGANADAECSQLERVESNADTLYVMQMEVPVPEVEKAVRTARARGGRVMLNVAPSRPFDYSVCSDIDVLVLNEGEAGDMAASLGIDLRGGAEIARALAQKFDLFCIVTLGSAGSVGCTPEGEMMEVRASRFGQAIDTTGAGDCYCGVLAASLDQGLTGREAMQRASVAAGLSVLVRGAQSGMPAAREIDAALQKTSQAA